MTEPPGYSWLARYANIPSRIDVPAQTIIEAFDHLAASKPERTAIWFHDEAITHAELRQVSCRLAQALAGLGIREGDRVAVMGQNTPALAVAMLGAWRAGGVVVPLNPMLKSVEVRKILADSRAAAVIAAAALWQPLADDASKGTAVRAVVLTGEQIDERPAVARSSSPTTMLMADLIAEGPLASPTGRLTPDGIAALMYTSGTTGEPKGAVIRHRHLAAS